MAIPTSSPSRIGEQLLSANKKLWSRYAEEDARSHSLRAVLYMPTSIEDHHEKKHYEVVPSVFDGYKEVSIRDKETFRREYECTSTPSSPTDTTGRLADDLAVTSAVMKATAATISAFDIKVFADAMYGAMRPTALEDGVSDVSPHPDDSPDRPNDKPTLMNDAFGYWS